MRNEVTNETDTPSDDIGVMEAIVTPESPLVDSTPARMRLYDHYQVNLLAVSRAGKRIAHQLRSVRLKEGDVIVLQGNLNEMPEALGELRVLPLAERGLALGRGRRGFIPVIVLAIAMLLVALHVVPVAIAFFGAAAVIVLLKALSLREAYDAVEWPILVMLAALIPLSDALRTTGGTDVIAGWLSAVAGALPPVGTLALIMIVAMAVTPFLNNAATVLVMGPIAARFATNLGLSPRSVPDGGRDRGGVRLPHPDRTPVQHAGDGCGWLSVHRLLEARTAAVGLCGARRRAADRAVLATRGALIGYRGTVGKLQPAFQTLGGKFGIDAAAKAFHASDHEPGAEATLLRRRGMRTRRARPNRS